MKSLTTFEDDRYDYKIDYNSCDIYYQTDKSTYLNVFLHNRKLNTQIEYEMQQNRLTKEFVLNKKSEISETRKKTKNKDQRYPLNEWVGYEEECYKKNVKGKFRRRKIRKRKRRFLEKKSFSREFDTYESTRYLGKLSQMQDDDNPNSYLCIFNSNKIFGKNTKYDDDYFWDIPLRIIPNEIRYSYFFDSHDNLPELDSDYYCYYSDYDSDYDY